MRVVIVLIDILSYFIRSINYKDCCHNCYALGSQFLTKELFLNIVYCCFLIYRKKRLVLKIRCLSINEVNTFKLLADNLLLTVTLFELLE